MSKSVHTRQPTILIVGMKRNPQAVKPFKRFLSTPPFSPMNEFMGCCSSPDKFICYQIGCEPLIKKPMGYYWELSK